jgi:hypothetical protein
VSPGSLGCRAVSKRTESLEDSRIRLIVTRDPGREEAAGMAVRTIFASLSWMRLCKAGRLEMSRKRGGRTFRGQHRQRSAHPPRLSTFIARSRMVRTSHRRFRRDRK